MINSRDLKDLHPYVADLAAKFIKGCEDKGIKVIITSTYRDFESQNDLYAQGRTKKGNKVTNAKAGQSYHNYRLAFDFCPIVNGKAEWNDLKLYAKCGAIGKSLGLEWAGDWKSFKEYAHFQAKGLNLANLRNGIYPDYLKAGLSAHPAIPKVAV